MWAMLNFSGSSSAPSAKILASGTPGSNADSRREIGVRRGVGEVPLHHLHREPVDAGGHRGVGGEHRAGPHHGQRGVEIQPASTSSRMRSTPRNPAWPSFMWNTSGAGKPFDGGERADRPYAADAGQDLLLDAVLLVAAVEPVGDRRAGRDRSPGCRNPAAATEFDRPARSRPAPAAARMSGIASSTSTGSPACVGEQPQRQSLRIQRRVVLVLPAVGGQRLPEVARAVVQAHRDQRQAQVRRGLQVVSGQDPQAAGIVRQHLGNAELHREVGDAVGHRGAVALLAAGTTAAGSDSRRARRPARRAGPGSRRRRRARRAGSG